jgi:hypothetical protein
MTKKPSSPLGKKRLEEEREGTPLSEKNPTK